jgi:hypothetical protein
MIPFPIEIISTGNLLETHEKNVPKITVYNLNSLKIS